MKNDGTPGFVLTSDDATIRLRTIEAADCEALRVWKNAHRQAFFDQTEITPEAQRAWYAGYCTRPDDFMFVIETSIGAPIGCVGVRLLGDGQADVYNVILADPASRGRGLGTLAMRLVSMFGGTLAPVVGLKVLRDNPAVAMYLKLGYDISSEAMRAGTPYYGMTLNAQRFQPLPYHVTVRTQPDAS